MKRKSKDDTLSPKKPHKDLHYFFAKAKAKAEKTANDDSILFVKEVKAPKTRDTQKDDPDWNENVSPKSAKKWGATRHREGNQRQPSASSSTTRRISTVIASNASSSSISTRLAAKSNHHGLVLSSSDSECEGKSSAKTMRPHKTDIDSSPDRRTRSGALLPVKNCPARPKWSIKTSSMKQEFGNAYQRKKSAITTSHAKNNDSDDATMPMLSLKVLDSQEYYALSDCNNSDSELQGDDERDRVSACPTADIEHGCAAEASEVAVDSSDKSSYAVDQSDNANEHIPSDGGESPGSQPLLMDPELLQAAENHRVQNTDEVITLSSDSECESRPTKPTSDTSVLTVNSANKLSQVPSAVSATPSTVKRRRKTKSLRRLDVTKQLFPTTPTVSNGLSDPKASSGGDKQSTLSSTSIPTTPLRNRASPSKLRQAKSHSPSAAVGTPSKMNLKLRTMLSKSTGNKMRSKTWGPKSARKARALKQSLKNKRLDLTIDLSGEALTSTPSHKDKVKREIIPAAYTGAETADKQTEETRAMSPDDVLEEVMLSLNASNTYSPTKRTPSKHRIPYYLANFRVALAQVMNSPIDVRYFNLDDVSTITTFGCCNEQTQMLYMRMLFRRHDWIAVKTLNYDEVGDINMALREMMERQLVVDNSSEESLHVLLMMLPAPRLKKICKDMKIPEKNNRTELIKAMMKHATQQTVSSMLKTTMSTEQAMMKRIRAELPMCYKLTDEARGVFLRILMLYALVFEVQTAQKDKTRSQLIYTMLRETMGQIRYPVIPTNRQTVIFPNREYVCRRRKGEDLEEILDNYLSKKMFDEALPYCDEAKQLYKLWGDDSLHTSHDKELPTYLRRYTCMAQMIRCLGYAAEVLQKKKLWQQAADLYQLMLSQHVYSLSKRGYWSDRLALIYDFHIKNKQKALEVIKQALNDEHIKVGNRLLIYQRLERMRKSPASRKLTEGFEDLKHDEIIPAPTNEISGVTLDRQIPDSDRVNLFVTTYSDGSISQCSVEKVALNHYMSTYKLNRGLHAESSVFTTIYGLLFWDIIYKPGIADTFYNNYQYQPLDFQTDLFYERRKQDLDERLETVRKAGQQELLALIEPVWNDHYDECSVCVSWSVFKSPEDAVGLMMCMGLDLVADMCDRFIKCYRFCRSGMPDLTMWNADTKVYKIVEVKGPSDKLSTKQILWMDFFMRRSAAVEVCHVKVSARNLNHRKATEANS